MMRRALVILVDPGQPGLTDRERVGIALRNTATLTGACACGAKAGEAWVNDRDGLMHMEMHHESECPATDAALEDTVERLGESVRYLFCATEYEEVGTLA